MEIINIKEDIDSLRERYKVSERLKIDNFLDEQFAESLYKYVYLEKSWTLATGLNKNKYEKKNVPMFDKINQLQIKNVSDGFGKDEFSYIFYRAMNNQNISYFEFILRKTLNSHAFIDILNNITGLNLTQLTTLFLSKYKSGNFLSPHSDQGNGRLAFVINLSKFWKPQYGGNLHFLNDDRTEIIETFVPGFNNMLIFYVPEENGIPHYVSHIAPNVKFSRYAITGWFN